MNIIIDAGGSKLDIREISQGIQIKVRGFNPMLYSNAYLEETLQSDPSLISLLKKAKTIRYFGAGCEQNKEKMEVKKTLQSIALEAQVEVHHDLDLLAYCWGQHAPCFVSILGTGSNCMLIEKDTTKQGYVTQQLRPSLGYILGDDGGGVWFGKCLLRDYFTALMPVVLRKAFEKKYGLELRETLRRIYKESGSNTFIASFAPFLFEHRHNTYIQSLLTEGFASFIQRFIPSNYHHQAEIPLYVAGSIGSIFETELRQVADAFGITVREVSASPLDSLMI